MDSQYSVQIAGNGKSLHILIIQSAAPQRLDCSSSRSFGARSPSGPANSCIGIQRLRPMLPPARSSDTRARCMLEGAPTAALVIGRRTDRAIAVVHALPLASAAGVQSRARVVVPPLDDPVCQCCTGLSVKGNPSHCSSIAHGIPDPSSTVRTCRLTPPPVPLCGRRGLVGVAGGDDEGGICHRFWIVSVIDVARKG